MNGCCFDNHGWIPVVATYLASNLTLKTKGLFNIKIENTGAVDCSILGVGRINSGETKCIGIDQVPCADDIRIEFISDQSGKKELTVWASKIICFDWKCLTQK